MEVYYIIHTEFNLLLMPLYWSNFHKIWSIWKIIVDHLLTYRCFTFPEWLSSWGCSFLILLYCVYLFNKILSLIKNCLDFALNDIPTMFFFCYLSVCISICPLKSTGPAEFVHTSKTVLYSTSITCRKNSWYTLIPLSSW